MYSSKIVCYRITIQLIVIEIHVPRKGDWTVSIDQRVTVNDKEYIVLGNRAAWRQAKSCCGGLPGYRMPLIKTPQDIVDVDSLPASTRLYHA